LSILEGDALTVLATLPHSSVQSVVTSPPYWGLRDYGVVGQLGLEKTPEEYVDKLVDVFREVRRVLRDDGTLFLNIGDCYASGGKGGGGSYMAERRALPKRGAATGWRPPPAGLKHKDRVGIPWMLAFSLRADGWYLRDEIIWHKPNPMPSSVTDRTTSAHEQVFLLSKKSRYYYDHIAIREPLKGSSVARLNPDLASQEGSHRANAGEKTNGTMKAVRFGGNKGGGNYGAAVSPHSGAVWHPSETANKRSVWTIATSGFSEAHFATMPPKLAETCILAGTRIGDTVLDPFSGAGTTGLVAARTGREYVGIEINTEYAEMARRRIAGDAPLFEAVAP
jgi:DNA modification methylase